MLLGLRALESSLKITNLMVVPRLSLCAFSSSLDTRAKQVRRHRPGFPCSPLATAPAGHTPDAEHIVIEEHLGLEADLDQVGDGIHVFWPMRVAVHAHRHQQVLRWPGQLQGGQKTTEHTTTTAQTPKEGPHELCFTNTAHLGVLQPHLQPLHGQQSHFLIATGGCEQPQEVPGHVVDGLATVQLVTKHVQNILFYALCEFIVPRPEGGKGGQEGCQLRGPYFGLLRLRLSAHLPWHELPLLLRT